MTYFIGGVYVFCAITMNDHLREDVRVEPSRKRLLISVIWPVVTYQWWIKNGHPLSSRGGK